MAQFNFDAIGTKWQIDLPPDISKEMSGGLLARIRARIDLFDAAYSRFRKDSLVYRMSLAPGTFSLPDDAPALLGIYRDLYLRTGGLFTPLVGGMLSDAGYDAEYSLRQKKPLEAAPAWDSVMEYSHPNLTMKEPATLDFGAAGKGYLVDLVGEVIEASGIRSYTVDAGGDILHKGPAPIRVGLEDPEDTGSVIGVCALSGGSICGSAGNRRAWENFHHIIDPKKLSSPREVLAVWVSAKTALVADAIATCLFFVEPGQLSPAYDFEYLIMRSDRAVARSEGFPAELFTRQN